MSPALSNSVVVVVVVIVFHKCHHHLGFCMFLQLKFTCSLFWFLSLLPALSYIFLTTSVKLNPKKLICEKVENVSLSSKFFLNSICSTARQLHFVGRCTEEVNVSVLVGLQYHLVLVFSREARNNPFAMFGSILWKKNVTSLSESEMLNTFYNILYPPSDLIQLSCATVTNFSF